MTDTSQADAPPPQTNGISDMDEEERAKMRPVDIDADVREMERRKRVEVIMNSRLFREELERIIESQLKEGSGGTSHLLQQISDMVGVDGRQSAFKSSSSCVIPVNDIRGVEAMGYAKGEKMLRCKLACLFRLIDLYGWAYGSGTQITARLNQDDEQFLVNPYGMLFHELTASSLIKVDMRGAILEQGTTNFSVNISAFSLHAAVHSARPDIKCIVHVHTPSVVALSSLKQGMLPLSQESVVIGEVSTHTYLGGLLDPEEKDKLARNLGPNNKVLLLANQGALCCGETIEEAFFNARNTVLASESQLKLMPIGIDNLVLISDEIRKRMYDAAHNPPESTPRPDAPTIMESKVERKWRVGGAEFEALMRMLDNAGFRTGYIYRRPLVKGEPPKPRNDVEVPPAVSSLGYLLEEEELYRQGLWRKLEGGRKGNDRSRWLNSPNSYQKVEILETGTQDPKKITKWVAENSPSHSSTPVRIESALQFVPKGTNPKEFKFKQQAIKDYRRADKISAGPQSHILEGVTWEEAKKMQDATVTQTGDQVVLMGAASKGIIQRGHQHNAMVYKSPYAKNPFDCVTDEELDEYKKVVEKKSKGEYDTDFSESEGLSSAALNKRMDEVHIRSPTSVTSETEEESRDEPQILRIETKTAPRPSQPEVVLSDDSPVDRFLRAERISVDSYKGYKAVVPTYRTYSHAGFPKGSYLIPNPTHFHIARQTQIAIQRPLLVKVNPHKSSQYLFNHGRRNSTVTIDLGNSRTVSVNIPLHTLTGFIYPFANALNYRRSTGLSNNGTQTAYMQNFEHLREVDKVAYTPIYVDSYKTCHTQPESCQKSASFEQQVLDNMQQQMLELTQSTESEYDSVEIIDDTQYESAKDLVDFTEDDQEINESLVELTPEVAAMLPSTDSSSTASGTNLTYVKRNPQDESFDVDEGIGECTLTNDTLSKDKSSEGSVEDAVQEMSKMIVEYLIEQCFELKELILFPEVLHDPNLTKLLAKLLNVYAYYYGDSLGDEEKTEVRVSVAKQTLKMAESDDRLNTSGESGSSNGVSDKIFSISEFMNDILDRFFASVENGCQFSEFAKVLEADEGELLQSTPEVGRIRKLAEDDNFEITTFHKRTISSSGTELYWMSISPSKTTTTAEITPARPVMNIDDIPLKPPDQLQRPVINIDDIPLKLPDPLRRPLSPIVEECRMNLFDSYYLGDFGSNDSVSDKYDIVDEEDDRINLEKPPAKFVLLNEVNFLRSKNVGGNSYVQTKTALFKGRYVEDKENDPVNLDDSGDWSGYDAARF
ncbi:unnamed protein product [Phaedon cochleariae]|uniref:Class II aldolase/adducin N-terminal domain-containing protein n=1 Tax=Phaedon cochleariae TaxID=80249 RepID=A0A9P0DSU7_PHACE|nr:unnamed protein product [Phaedon cochleariae]